MYNRLVRRLSDQEKSLKGQLIAASDGIYWMYDDLLPGPTLLGVLDDSSATDDMVTSFKMWKQGMFGLVLDERWVKFRGTPYPYLKVLTSSGEVGWIYEMWCAEVS